MLILGKFSSVRHQCFKASFGPSVLASGYSNTIGKSLSQTHYYNRRGREYAEVNLWNGGNNILGPGLSKSLYNEAVRDEITSYIRMQLTDGISSINSEVLTFIITQEIAKKKECGE